jgi:hypothetical protein
MKKLSNFLGTASTLGLSVYAGAGLGRAAIGAAADYLSRGQQQPPSPTPPIPGAPGVEAQIIPEAPIKKAMEEEPQDILGELGITDQVKNMLSAGNPVENIAKIAVSYLSNTPAGKELKKKFGKGLESLILEGTKRIAEQIAPAASQEPKISEDVASIQQPQPQPQIPDQEIPETPQEQPSPTQQEGRLKGGGFQKDQIVRTNDGRQGRVVSSLTKTSIVEIDGKKQRIANDTLTPIEAQPSDIDVDISEGFTPPERKLSSAAVNGMTYNTKTKELIVKFNSGAVYLYEDVPEDVYQRFSKGKASAKTSGQNEFGTWWVGKNPSLGASFWKEVRQSGYKYRRIS